MSKLTRNIGLEILHGLREIKSGKHGRVINIPTVTSIRERTGLSQVRFAALLVCRCARFRNGNRAGARRQVPRVRCCSSHRRIPRFWSMWHEFVQVSAAKVMPERTKQTRAKSLRIAPSSQRVLAR